MTEGKYAWIELAKYPVAVLSVFLALVGAKFILNIPFGSVSEITKDGVKFTQDAKGEIAALSSRLNEATKSIEEIKRQLPSSSLSPAANSAIFEASQTVPDQTAQVATIGNNTESGKAGINGYIWIGDYNKALSNWQRTILVSPATNAPLATPPSTVTPGTVFTVSDNMVLRAGLPRNDTEYYRGQRSLGVLPTGTRIKILSAPVDIHREFVVQYWVQVAIQP